MSGTLTLPQLTVAPKHVLRIIAHAGHLQKWGCHLHTAPKIGVYYHKLLKEPPLTDH